MTDSKNRGVKDTFFLVCDAPKGMPEVVGNVWPLTSVETCTIHLISNAFKLASKMDWNALKRDVKPVYVKLCDRGRQEFVPFLNYDLKVRAVISSTNAIESLNARYRRPVRARGTSRPIRRR